jgi:hypothetical protein
LVQRGRGVPSSRSSTCLTPASVMRWMRWCPCGLHCAPHWLPWIADTQASRACLRAWFQSLCAQRARALIVPSATRFRTRRAPAEDAHCGRFAPELRRPRFVSSAP